MTLVLDRLHALREYMKTHKIEALYIPKADLYQGENIRPADERLEAVTGFTGSAGFAVIMPEAGALFVDSRYTIQAKMQVATTGLSIVDWPKTDLAAWLADLSEKPGSLSYDPRFTTYAASQKIENALSTHGIKFTAIEKNPVDQIWKDKPNITCGAVYTLDDALTGQDYREKIDSLRAWLTGIDCDGFITTAPDAVAWLLNIRGSDIENTPVPLYSAYIPRTGDVQVFGLTKWSNPPDGVTFTKSDDAAMRDFLANLKGKIVFDGSEIPAYFAAAISSSQHQTNPIIAKKAIKNSAEEKATARAHQIDGIAVSHFLAWLDESNPVELDEIKARNRLLELRMHSSDFQGPSFETISGYNANGAIVHYRVDESSNAQFQENGLYLVDSGGQYPGATTDITRTVSIGIPPHECRAPYTAVLEGLAHLSMLRFPKGTSGRDIDAIARNALWNLGLDYGHGTGHGVGAGLSVHEGPASISKRGEVALEAGMILSIEPGYYLEDAFGIRIENLVIIKQASDGFLYFDTLTLAPIDKRPIDLAYLSIRASNWLDRYHRRVHDQLIPHIDDKYHDWFAQACAPLKRGTIAIKP